VIHGKTSFTAQGLLMLEEHVNRDGGESQTETRKGLNGISTLGISTFGDRGRFFPFLKYAFVRCHAIMKKKIVVKIVAVTLWSLIVGVLLKYFYRFRSLPENSIGVLLFTVILFVAGIFMLSLGHRKIGKAIHLFLSSSWAFVRVRWRIASACQSPACRNL
jgi:hypothetical protein